MVEASEAEEMMEFKLKPDNSKPTLGLMRDPHAGTNLRNKR